MLKFGLNAHRLGLCAYATDMKAGNAVADFFDACTRTVTFEHGQNLSFLYGFAFADAQFLDDATVSGLNDLGFFLWNHLSLCPDDLVNFKRCCPHPKSDQDQQ